MLLSDSVAVHRIAAFTTAQSPLATEERSGAEQGQANQSITMPLCPQTDWRQLTSIQLESDVAQQKSRSSVMVSGDRAI